MSLGSDIEKKLRRYFELRDRRDETKTAAENAEKEYREYEQEIWQELAESPLEGAIRVNLGEDIGTITFTPKETPFGRIIDKEKAMQAFEEMGRKEELIAGTIQKGRLNEYVRECLENGNSLPEGVDFYTQRRVSISQPKKDDSGGELV